jgi:hypothetical protein
LIQGYMAGFEPVLNVSAVTFRFGSMLSKKSAARA